MFPSQLFDFHYRAVRLATWAVVLIASGVVTLNGTAQVAPATAAVDEEAYPRSAKIWVEAQVELARRGFSGGAIDGIRGPQSTAALQAFQQREDVPPSGVLDAATQEILQLEDPALAPASLTAEDLATLRPLPTTWLEKSQQPVLAHATALELAAERFHATPTFLKRLNPNVDWEALTPETVFLAPAVQRLDRLGSAARIVIRLAGHTLEVCDSGGRVIAHFPVSIARKAEKRPLGELHVTVVVRDPNYTFDPEVFPESAEARELGRKLIVPPGPNNPVGVAWIGLDLPGYGIHGTPDPEKVGRTESHGCFRLANWDAHTLLTHAWVGLPVIVEP